MATDNSPADVSTLGYEQARDELVALVARLESGRVPLEESMQLWERGEALAAHCQGWLDRAQARLEGGDGDAAGTPRPGAPAATGRQDAEAVADDEAVADEELDAEPEDDEPEM